MEYHPSINIIEYNHEKARRLIVIIEYSISIALLVLNLFSCTLFLSVLTIALWGRYYWYPPFTDDKTEVERGLVNAQSPTSKLAAFPCYFTWHVGYLFSCSLYVDK